MSAERVIQAAIHAALVGDATYAALVGTDPDGMVQVYDGEAPHGARYPYTVLGSMTEVGDHVMEADGWDHTVTIHDWTDAKGRKVLQQIREARDDVLHNAQLAVSGFTLTTIRREFAEVLTQTDPDNKTIRHQVTRYRVRSLATA